MELSILRKWQECDRGIEGEDDGWVERHRVVWKKISSPTSRNSVNSILKHWPPLGKFIHSSFGHLAGMAGWLSRKSSRPFRGLFWFEFHPALVFQYHIIHVNTADKELRSPFPLPSHYMHSFFCLFSSFLFISYSALNFFSPSPMLVPRPTECEWVKSQGSDVWCMSPETYTERQWDGGMATMQKTK